MLLRGKTSARAPALPPPAAARPRDRRVLAAATPPSTTPSSLADLLVRLPTCVVAAAAAAALAVREKKRTNSLFLSPRRPSSSSSSPSLQLAPPTLAATSSYAALEAAIKERGTALPSLDSSPEVSMKRERCFLVVDAARGPRRTATAPKARPVPIGQAQGVWKECGLILVINRG